MGENYPKNWGLDKGEWLYDSMGERKVKKNPKLLKHFSSYCTQALNPGEVMLFAKLLL